MGKCGIIALEKDTPHFLEDKHVHKESWLNSDENQFLTC